MCTESCASRTFIWPVFPNRFQEIDRGRHVDWPLARCIKSAQNAHKFSTQIGLGTTRVCIREAKSQPQNRRESALFVHIAFVAARICTKSADFFFLQHFSNGKNAAKMRIFASCENPFRKTYLTERFFQKPHCLYSFGVETFSWTKLCDLLSQIAKNGKKRQKTWQVSAVETHLQYRTFCTQVLWVVFERFSLASRHG